MEGPLFTGRTWREYMKMFDLETEDIMSLRILDCPAGSSSFTPFMISGGADVTACDIIYKEKPETLSEKCLEHLEFLTEALRRVKDNFNWEFYTSPDEMFEKRLEACRCFTDSYKKHPEAYVQGDIMKLPFDDESFDLVLSSHLLFIYDHRLDWGFHRRALDELIRVSSGEVRVYPLVKENGELSGYVERFIRERDDVEARIVTVDYEFRRNGNPMLLIRRP